MTAGERIQLHIDDLTGSGDGVARTDRGVVFVPGALPGETCTAEIRRVGSGAAFARLLSADVPSPARCAPDCPLAGRCGGCAFRHTDYATELDAKARQVQACLARIGHVDLAPERVLGAPSRDGWRNKAMLHARDGALGFCEAESHLPAEGPCPALEASGEADRIRRTVAAHYAREGGALSGLLLRISHATPDLSVCLVTDRPVPSPDKLTDALRAAVPRISGISLCPPPRRGSEGLGQGARPLWGDPRIRDTLCGLSFSIDPAAFFQVNTPMAETLYRTAAEFADLRPGETLIDLYCGIGSIGLSMASLSPGIRLFGGEIVPEAVDCARENARCNHIPGEFFTGDAKKVFADLLARGIRADCVVVDPPRKGLSPDLPGLLASMAPRRIVYVSCDPATLARDVARLAPDYAPTRLAVCDLFPGTGHVETVVLMSRDKE